MFPKINPQNVLISKLLKKTSQYDIYSVLDFSLSLPLTLTLSKPCSQETLAAESQILTTLLEIPGVPQIYWFGELNNRFSMITSPTGPAILKEISAKNRFSPENAAKLGIELLHVIEKIHEKGLLFRNLSPQTIVYGAGLEKNLVKLRDFSQAQVFCENSRHVPFAKTEEFVGSVDFASCDAHDFLQQSRRSDLEALGFVLCFACCGKLPWQEVRVESFSKKVRFVGEQKKKFVKSLGNCEDLPRFLKEFFECIEFVGFFDKPNYEELREILEKFCCCGGNAQNCENARNSCGKWSEESLRLGDGGSTISEKKREIIKNSRFFASFFLLKLY